MATFDGSDDLDAEQMPVIDRLDKEYKIYVDNLPEELKEDAIRQVFSSYGKITGMFYRPNTTWTYITYGSYREAELAIRELNNKKPLYLKVALAKERSAKEEFKHLGIEIKEKPHMTELLPAQNVKHTPQSKGRGYAIHKYIAVPDVIVPHKYMSHHEEERSFSPLSSVYKNDDFYTNTNQLWTRGVLTVTSDGKRHVSLGRGYSMYEIPEPDPRCEDYITEVYELRKKGLYEYGDDKLKNGLQKCIVCFAKTTQRCEKCYTYYCSKACQITHWPLHQAECERMPNLVDETLLEQVVKNETIKPQSSNNTHVQVNKFNSSIKLRRPNTPAQVQILNTSMQRMNCINQITDKCPNNQLDNEDNVPKEKIVVQPAVNATSNKILQNHLNRYNTNENIDQTKKNDQSSITLSHTRQNSYTRSCKNDSTDNISPDKETNKNNHLRDKFSNDVGHPHQKNGFQNERKPPYNHRGTIENTTITTTNKQEQKLSMLSMDAEKTMAVEVEERSENLAARTIKNSSWSSNTNNAPQDKFSPNIKKTSAIRLCNILDVFANLLVEKAVPELTVSGVIQIFERTQKNIYCATLVPDNYTSNMEKIVNDLPAVCMKIIETASNYKPQVGDLVCGEVEDGVWYRGYVTSLLPELRIAVVDEARILPATRTLPYPKEFLDICTYGVTCEVTNAELQVNEVYNFIAVVKEHNKKQNSVKIKIEKDNKDIEGVIKPWQPVINTVPALAELRNGSKICLTNYRNQYIMFAHSLDESEVEYTNNIMQHVAHCSQTAPRLSKPPSIEQMVIAPYVDGNKYRAMITKIQSNIATIVYVDFGNFTDINVDELQEIPDDLAVKRSCSAKLLLKDVPRDVPMTVEVDAYLRDLVGREEPLLCICDNESFKDGVHLTTSNGENVNDKIKELLIPNWKKDNYDDRTCYMINDMDIAPLGKVGDTIEALVLYQPENDKLVYMMGPSDLHLITHITNEMPKSIQEYCEKTQYYIPRKEELCLALYDGAWYRALCFNPKKSQTTCEIFFVDYGNIEPVEHKDVRQMPETFIRPAAMANICIVVNLAPVDSTGNYSVAVKQRVSELVEMNTLVDIKIVEFVESGEYKIELPKIRATLEQEHLIPSSF